MAICASSPNFAERAHRGTQHVPRRASGGRSVEEHNFQGASGSPAGASSRPRAHKTDREWTRAKASADLARQRLEGLARDYARGTLTRAEWRAARPDLIERLFRGEAALIADRRETVVAEFVADPERLRSTWS